MKETQTLKRFLASTPMRSFILYPLCVLLFELWRQGGALSIQWAGGPLMAAGYLQYRWVGAFRSRLAGGGPGIARPPERILSDGPYAWVRNPMYLGHLIFTLGLAVTLRSWLALALLIGMAVWFDRRVRSDEVRLEAAFGDNYRNYKRRVGRWIPRWR